MRDMNAYLNKVQIMGNLGRDPEVRNTQDGKEVVTLRIATSEYWKDKLTNERKDRIGWHIMDICAVMGCAEGYNWVVALYINQEWAEKHAKLAQEKANNIFEKDYKRRQKYLEKARAKYLKNITPNERERLREGLLTDRELNKRIENFTRWDEEKKHYDLGEFLKSNEKINPYDQMYREYSFEGKARPDQHVKYTVMIVRDIPLREEEPS